MLAGMLDHGIGAQHAAGPWDDVRGNKRPHFRCRKDDLRGAAARLEFVLRHHFRIENGALSLARTLFQTGNQREMNSLRGSDPAHALAGSVSGSITQRMFLPGPSWE